MKWIRSFPHYLFPSVLDKKCFSWSVGRHKQGCANGAGSFQPSGKFSLTSLLNISNEVLWNPPLGSFTEVPSESRDNKCHYER